MTTTTFNPELTYLPLQRRAWLVRAFAALVRALPPVPSRDPRLLQLPEHLRRDLGLPPSPLAVSGRKPPPPFMGSGLM